MAVMVADMRDLLGSRSVEALFAIAAVLYLGLPMEAVLGFPLDPASSYLSELAAKDQPHGVAFRLADGIGAVLVLVGVTLLSARCAPPRSAVYGTVTLALFAVATIADVIFPMACATSADPECARGDAEHTLGLSHQIHLVSSALALAAVNVSAVLLSAFATRRRRRAHQGLPVALLVLAAVLLVSSVTVSVAALAGATDGALPAGAGYLQRVQTVSVCLYLLVFPWVLARATAAPA